MLMGCLLLMIGSYLTVCSDFAFCSDQRTESSPSSNATAQGPAMAGPRKRPVTVADSIQMTRLGDPSYTDGEPSKGIVAKISADGKHFVVILKKGNLEANANEYSLLLFQTAAVFQSPEPEVLVSLASSSNRPAIENVFWLDDNDTILFLGQPSGEQTALYSVKCSSKELRKLTSHATNLISFVSTANGEEIVYAAKTAVSTFLTDSVSRKGIAVTNEWVTDLIRGSYGGKEYDNDSLFIKRSGKGAETRIAIQGQTWGLPMSLSPDGAQHTIDAQPYANVVGLVFQMNVRGVQPMCLSYQISQHIIGSHLVEHNRDLPNHIFTAGLVERNVMINHLLWRIIQLHIFPEAPIR